MNKGELLFIINFRILLKVKLNYIYIVYIILQNNTRGLIEYTKTYFNKIQFYLLYTTHTHTQYLYL